MTFHGNRTAKSWNGRSALAQQHPHRYRTVEVLKQVQNPLTEMFDGLALQRGDHDWLLHRQAVIRSGVEIILLAALARSSRSVRSRENHWPWRRS